jgi:hypothetical protein
VKDGIKISMQKGIVKAYVPDKDKILLENIARSVTKNILKPSKKDLSGTYLYSNNDK